jgi:hypothetical protein
MTNEETVVFGLGSCARFEAELEQIGEEAHRGGGGMSDVCWLRTLWAYGRRGKEGLMPAPMRSETAHSDIRYHIWDRQISRRRMKMGLQRHTGRAYGTDQMLQTFGTLIGCLAY